MTKIRASFPKIRLLFPNFWKRAGETFPLPSIVTRLYSGNFKIKDTLVKRRNHKYYCTGNMSFRKLLTNHQKKVKMQINFLNPWIHMSVKTIFDVKQMDIYGKGKLNLPLLLLLPDLTNLITSDLTQKWKIYDFKRFRPSHSQNPWYCQFSMEEKIIISPFILKKVIIHKIVT